jgi:hypothetical protein
MAKLKAEDAKLLELAREQSQQPGVQEILAVHARWLEIEAAYTFQQQLVGSVASIAAASSNLPVK